ncbi:MAG TPA: helix-turn-helix transcriptional regulator [Rubrivivax sp.]|nr:helix-turn-helix transcriptional regulator [Rubrivivax sp.]HOW47585.1 helix-turn-helix transcriptional regulator [Rubrivivax sp.]HRY89306.1 helix-turn-helix transcriptional regulator [Rubrivivax sp.]HRZ61486.1 helix-turn-helix transcriptional regulator [Rubrivivax sp.]
MKHSAGLSGLRALGMLGLAPQLYIPALLEALHGVLPSRHNLFDWTDAQGRLLHYCFEGAIDHKIAALYFNEFHNRREADAMPTFRDAVNGGPVIRPADELDNARFFGSALYREIWEPQGLHTRVEAVVKRADGSPLGSLVLYRGPGERRFTRADEALLAQVARYAAHALEAPGAGMPAGEHVARRDRGAVLSLGLDGRLQHLSADALKLLLLAHGGITPASAGRAPRREDFPTLTLLLERHRGAGGAAQASLTVDNAWGRFSYDSTLLAPLGPDAAPLIHVGIVQHEPMRLAAWRAIQALPLTPAQREVCALLHAGHTRPEIAQSLAIAASTAGDHVKQLYGRLGVGSVQELSALIHQRVGARTA